MSDDKARILELENALRPFARAGHRVAYYGSPSMGTDVVALTENTIFELFANDNQFNEGEDKLLSVADLLTAYSTMPEKE